MEQNSAIADFPGSAQKNPSICSILFRHEPILSPAAFMARQQAKT